MNFASFFVAIIVLISFFFEILDWINYALIDDITDGFMPVLRFIELEVDSIDDLVLILKESEQV